MSLDVILFVTAAWGFYQGYSHGIIQTVFNFVSYFFALLVAFKLTPATTAFLSRSFDNHNPLMFIAGFLVMFVLVMMLFRLAGRGFEGVLSIANAGLINRAVGGVVLSAFYVLLLSILCWFAAKANLIDEETKHSARSWPLLEAMPPMARGMAERVSPIVKDFWNSSVNMVDRLEQYSNEKTDVKQEVYDLPKPTRTGQDVFAPYSDEPEPPKTRSN